MLRTSLRVVKYEKKVVFDEITLKKRQISLILPFNLTIMRRILSYICILLSVLTLFSACERESEKKHKIGVSQCSGDYWRQKTNLDMQVELLNHPDVQLDFRNAENDSKRQEEDVRYFIDNDYDLIILSPNESEPLAEVVKEAKAKGIPVITFDRQVSGDDYTAHMEVDNFELGRAAAKFASSHEKKPLKIIEICGPQSASPAQLRHEGFIAGIKENPSAEVLASVCGEWDNARSSQLMDSLLVIYPETNFVFAHTDHMGIGVSDALKKHGREDIAIVGIDGFPTPGLKGVSDGDLTATFLYPTEGERLLRIALAVLNGEPYERITRVAPLPPIDASNVNILLAQDSLLNERTSKISLLNDKIDQQLMRYNTQKVFLWGTIAIVLLLIGLVFVMLWNINAHRRHHLELESKNNQLQEEKEKQERLYEQLEDATKSKLIFFTNVSHDLRTPLTLIAGPVEQVAEDPTLSPRSRSLIQLTKKNVGILRRLIDQILDFRKYENGKTEKKLSEVDFGSLLKDWTESFKEAARKRDIQLAIDIKTDHLPTVAVDVEKMERVFFNIMSNALKHTPDNGKITVSYAQTDTDVSYSVKDTGCGIDASEIERIFDPFYQAEGANPKGSGIGLALTKAFVELHGGSISVKSDKGKGSDFTVTIPIRHTENTLTVDSTTSCQDIENELSPADMLDDDFRKDKPTMLVVDDNQDIRSLLSDQLGEEYNILTAADGLQGLRMATKYVPDIIICDVMMPLMDGMECVKSIKEEISTSHIPVLMLTACSLDEQRVAGYDNGADAYISKPFNLEVLAARCRNLLANRRRIRDLYSKGASDTRKNSDKKSNAKPTKPIHRPNDVESDFYTHFVELVEERISDPDLQITELAAQMGLGQSQFTRKIKALTNYTPVELIRSLRLRKAKTMLLSTEKTISEIAFAVGFTSLAYFSKCYKDQFNESPSDTRTSHS